MAILHRATISPTKLELIGTWLPGQSWFGDVRSGAGLTLIGGYRFDDPAGRVGIETLLVRVGEGTVIQVPLTYRDAPMANGDGELITTAEHSVLGRRWVYDACGDPLYATVLAGALLGAVEQAEEWIETDDGPVRRSPTVVVTGDGARVVEVGAADVVTSHTEATVTVVQAAGFELRIERVVTMQAAVPAGNVLMGTWAGQIEPVLLAAGRAI